VADVDTSKKRNTSLSWIYSLQGETNEHSSKTRPSLLEVGKRTGKKEMLELAKRYSFTRK